MIWYFLSLILASDLQVYNHFLNLTQKRPVTDGGRYKEFLLKKIFTSFADSTSCDLGRFAISCDIASPDSAIDVMNQVAFNQTLSRAVLQSSDLPLLYSDTNRYPFSFDTPALFGARWDVRLRSAGVCDRVKDIVQFARGFSTPTHEFIWITGATKELSVAVSATQLDLPECMGHRGYTSVIERVPPFRVATTAVGFLESHKELNILSVLHTLQVKIPIANPDVFGLDVTVQNCLAITLLVFKSPVQPKVLIVPFNPEIDFSYNVIPQFSLSRAGDPIQQCSLRAAVTELARVKDADRASFGYSFVEIIGDLAVFIRSDILYKSFVHQPDAEAELNAARMLPRAIGKHDRARFLNPGHSAEELCDYLVHRRVKILTVSSDSLRCSLPVTHQKEKFRRSELVNKPDLFWSIASVPQVRIPAAASFLFDRMVCSQSECFCAPPYRGVLCHREDSRWRDGMNDLSSDQLVCSQRGFAFISAGNMTMVQRLTVAEQAEPCPAWFLPGSSKY